MLCIVAILLDYKPDLEEPVGVHKCTTTREVLLDKPYSELERLNLDLFGHYIHLCVVI